MDITIDNYRLAKDAVADIILMFVDMVESYDGFGNSVAVGSFDALEFIDCRILEPRGGTLGIDKSLLHSGAGVAVLCAVSDAWDYGWLPTGDASVLGEIRVALVGRRFSHLPEIEQALELGFGADEASFYRQMKVVHERYVVGYFRRLIGLEPAAVPPPQETRRSWWRFW